MTSRKMTRWTAPTALALMLALLASGSRTSAATAAHPTALTRGGTLTVTLPGAPASLDPSSADAADEYYFTLAYDALIAYDGTYKPLLATSWTWVGSGNKTLDITLRPHVTFSNGQAFNAKAVKAWLDIQIKNKTPDWGSLELASVQVTGPLSVRLHLAAANPLGPYFLARTFLSGDIPCPAASANPTMLKAGTCGAGPYMLDTKHTVTGDTYMYIPNPHYWNPAAVHWSRVVLKVVADPQAAINAVRAGQAQLTVAAQPTLIKSALSAGLQDAGVPQNIVGLDFLDKSGTVVPALKDVRVCQALNYAIDRTSLAAALGAGQGSPVSTQFLPGSDGYDPALNNYYSYNVAKAKALLAAAGYAHGLTLHILSLPAEGLSTAAQAVASYWQAVGVTAIVDNKPQLATFIAALTSGKYAVATAGLGATTPTLAGWACCFRPGAYWNPDKAPVPALQALIDKLSVAKPSEAGPIARQVNSYLTKNAWFVPIYSEKLNYVYDPKTVVMPRLTGAQPVVNIVDIRPAR